MRINHRFISALIISAMLIGCATTRSMYYNAWEKAGYAKRERLVDNVKAARTEQVEAKKEFANALEQFKSVVNYKGGDLEAVYNKLNTQYEACVSQADDVRSKIKAVKNVADALFTEWKGEIAEIKDDPTIKRQTQELYNKTQKNYGELISRMDAAAATMDPVLNKFHNRVIFIKSNLNAQAIASLRGTEIEMSGDIDKLVKQMEVSIKEADEFISQMQPPK